MLRPGKQQGKQLRCRCCLLSTHAFIERPICRLPDYDRYLVVQDSKMRDSQSGTPAVWAGSSSFVITLLCQQKVALAHAQTPAIL